MNDYSPKKIKRLLILFTVLFCQTVFAQSRQADSSKWSVGINYSINHNFYNKKGSFNGYSTPQDSIDRSRTTFFNIAVDLHLQINTKISIYTGLDFSNKGYQTRDYIVQASYSMGTHYLGGPGSPALYTIKVPLEMQNVYDFYYLSIPLGFDYCFGTKKIYLTQGGGLSADILLGYKPNSLYNDTGNNILLIPPNTMIDFPMKAIVLSGSVHSGICFKTAGGITWALQPFFTSNLISAIYNSTDDGSKLYLYTYGVSLGMLFY